MHSPVNSAVQCSRSSCSKLINPGHWPLLSACASPEYTQHCQSEHITNPHQCSEHFYTTVNFNAMHLNIVWCNNVSSTIYGSTKTLNVILTSEATEISVPSCQHCVHGLRWQRHPVPLISNGGAIPIVGRIFLSQCCNPFFVWFGQF